MKLRDYIKTYNNILKLETLSSLLKIINKFKFEESKILGHDGLGQVDFNIRKTFIYPLMKESESMTETHWKNLLCSIFNNIIKDYGNDLKLLDFSIRHVIDVSVLKYENTGFYNWHVDHDAAAPRTLSCIFMLNNDYEGGNLCFREPNGLEEIEMPVQPNTIIIWPSNFLYPHTVKPVTKGTRYSVVAWAL